VAHDVPAEPFVYDWFAAKSMDGSLPLGPGITPAFQVPDPQDLRLRLWVNGELQQDESTADMVCTAGPSATAPPGLDDGLRARIADQLAGRFKGDIIGPDHPQYDAARQVWNSMIDRSPGLILRCTSTADVVAAVNVARDNGLYPSVRCGGHNVAGKAMSDGGLTLDLSGLREVTVDAANKLVSVGGGSRLGDVDAAVASHGLIVPAGIMSETGVAGLSLGGGIGWFSRKHGHLHAVRGLRGSVGTMAAYSRSASKLGRVKAQYDPGNLFRANYTIVPAPAG
jgi:FAD/FMN-containing dehydrogenase